MTDCCSNRFPLPGMIRRIYPDKGTAAAIDPVLRCLLYQSRGVVDITAASGNASFGDDHEGGIFTRTFAKLVEDGIADPTLTTMGLFPGRSLFRPLQSRTDGVFITWAQQQRAARGGTSIKHRRSPRPSAWELVPNRKPSGSATTPQSRWSTISLGRRIVVAERPHRAAAVAEQAPAARRRRPHDVARSPFPGRQDRRAASRQDVSVSRQPKAPGFGSKVETGLVIGQFDDHPFWSRRESRLGAWTGSERSPDHYYTTNRSD